MTDGVAVASCALCAVVLFACERADRACDELAAFELVYLESDNVVQDGLPAYAGQALLDVSCGNGTFCHSPRATDRYGAPGGMSFDVQLACPDAAMCTDAEVGRLRQGREDALAWFDGIMREVESGRMPPGEVGANVASVGPSFRRTARTGGELLPGISSPEGREILRNWLACGAPLIERTVPESAMVMPGDDCWPEEIGDCVARAGTGVPIADPNWTSIYLNLIEPACASSCHGPSLPDQLARSQLDLRDATTAYDALVNQIAAGDQCASSGLTRVVPGDPDASLLIRKLRAAATCGAPMPTEGSLLPEASLEPIITWISAGAAND